MSLSITDLLPNTEYTFTVSANNSVGFGNSTTTKCTTPGESKKTKSHYLTYNYFFLVPPRINIVNVCLDWSINGLTALSINYTVSNYH